MRRAGEAEGDASNDCHCGDMGISGDGCSKAALNADTRGEGARSPSLSAVSASSFCVGVAGVILPAVGSVRPRIFSPPPPPTPTPVTLPPPDGDLPVRLGLVGVSSISTLMLGTGPSAEAAVSFALLSLS